MNLLRLAQIAQDLDAGGESDAADPVYDAMDDLSGGDDGGGDMGGDDGGGDMGGGDDGGDGGGGDAGGGDAGGGTGDGGGSVMDPVGHIGTPGASDDAKDPSILGGRARSTPGNAEYSPLAQQIGLSDSDPAQAQGELVDAIGKELAQQGLDPKADPEGYLDAFRKRLDETLKEVSAISQRFGE